MNSIFALFVVDLTYKLIFNYLDSRVSKYTVVKKFLYSSVLETVLNGHYVDLFVQDGSGDELQATIKLK